MDIIGTGSILLVYNGNVPIDYGWFLFKLQQELYTYDQGYTLYCILRSILNNHYTVYGDGIEKGYRDLTSTIPYTEELMRSGRGGTHTWEDIIGIPLNDGKVYLYAKLTWTIPKKKPWYKKIFQ
ncbi:alpha2 protein [Yata virus]|uniref:Alpha2 protein n=1 Tax=Yata virus TaxID=1272960 RepID=A0A096ZGU4_9RHAB|nr:alpha2 protein [Yata virus]AIR95575.1 alpha2 protein [Yata virus]